MKVSNRLRSFMYQKNVGLDTRIDASSQKFDIHRDQVASNWLYLNGSQDIESGSESNSIDRSVGSFFTILKTKLTYRYNGSLDIILFIKPLDL